MKKILFLSLALLPLISMRLIAADTECDYPYFGALTAGFVFKNDSKFKDVYKHGVINAITGDFCYYRWDPWGIGAKISYWRRKGRTSFLQLRSILQQVPITIYGRRVKRFNCGLQLYASLGAGLIWTKEKSYKGKETINKAIGEAEVGLNYPIWKRLHLTGAFRYLFPKQRRDCDHVMYGGFDLRAGLGFAF